MSSLANRETEQAVVDYLVANRGLSQEEAVALLRHYTHHGSKIDDPELRALVLAHKNTIGRDGRRASAQEVSR